METLEPPEPSTEPLRFNNIIEYANFLDKEGYAPLNALYDLISRPEKETLKPFRCQDYLYGGTCLDLATLEVVTFRKQRTRTAYLCEKCYHQHIENLAHIKLLVLVSKQTYSEHIMQSN